MRKVAPGVAGYVFLSICVVLLLGACVKPVDVKPFSENERKKTAAEISIGLGAINDIPPVLQADIAGDKTPVAANSTVSVSLDSLASVTITVTNDAAYDAIEWHYNLNPEATGSSLNLGSMAVFNTAGRYPVTVVGQKGVERYSTLFYIIVGS